MDTNTTAFLLRMMRNVVDATGAYVARARFSAWVLASLFVVVALPGCAVHDAMVDSDLRSIGNRHARSLERVKAAVATVKAEDLSESAIQERWGVLAKLADTNWRDYHVTEGSSIATFEWIYPGVLLEYRRQHNSYRSPEIFILFWYDPAAGKVVANDLMVVQEGRWAKPDAYPVQLVDGRTFHFLKPDGSPTRESFELSEDGTRYLMKREGFSHKRHEGEFRTPEQARQTLAGWAEARREKAWQRSKAEDQLFAAMLGGLQQTAVEYQKARADEAASLPAPQARVVGNSRPSPSQPAPRIASVGASTVGQAVKPASSLAGTPTGTSKGSSNLPGSEAPSLQVEKAADTGSRERAREVPKKTTLYQCAYAAHIGPGGKTYFSTIETRELPFFHKGQEFAKQAKALAGRSGSLLCQGGTAAELAAWRDLPGFKNTHIQTSIVPD